MITTVLTWLFIKHFVVDFPLQKPYQYLNKGTYGHWGGIQHALYHGVATALVIYLVLRTSLLLAVAYGVFDALVHYHIDWAKIKINTVYKLQSHTSERFWWLLGFDQLLHSLTYLWIASNFS